MKKIPKATPHNTMAMFAAHGFVCTDRKKAEELLTRVQKIMDWCEENGATGNPEQIRRFMFEANEYREHIVKLFVIPPKTYHYNFGKDE